MAKPTALTVEEEKDKILVRILDVEIFEYVKGRLSGKLDWSERMQ